MSLTAEQRHALIEIYAQGPARIRDALTRVPAAALKWRPAEGQWSVHEIVCHCADSEANAHMRIRYLVGESSPVISGYDQDRWAVAFDYHGHPLEPALAVIDAVRANTVALIRRLPDVAWAATGRHTEIEGSYGAENWLKVYSEHLESMPGRSSGISRRGKPRRFADAASAPCLHQRSSWASGLPASSQWAIRSTAPPTSLSDTSTSRTGASTRPPARATSPAR